MTFCFHVMLKLHVCIWQYTCLGDRLSLIITCIIMANMKHIIEMTTSTVPADRHLVATDRITPHTYAKLTRQS